MMILLTRSDLNTIFQYFAVDNIDSMVLMFAAQKLQLIVNAKDVNISVRVCFAMLFSFEVMCDAFLSHRPDFERLVSNQMFSYGWATWLSLFSVLFFFFLNISCGGEEKTSAYLLAI